MMKYNYALIVDPGDEPQLRYNKIFDRLNSPVFIIPYGRLDGSYQELRNAISSKRIDLIAFSRNEQVAGHIGIARLIRNLRIGYTSFSGIDEIYRIDQMRQCFSDLIKGSIKLDLPPLGKIPRHAGNPDRTFSLIFDCEQLGGIRYGLPRILSLLNRASVRATFFITNLMSTVYEGLVERLPALGHEVGLHGLYHEYLDGRSRSDQTEQIARMRKDLPAPSSGANFIGRMDAATVQALIDNDVQYYLYPAINVYRRFSYTRIHPLPARIKSTDKTIYAIPVTMETYGLSRFSINNIVQTICATARRSPFDHISVLCHPFRDGGIKRLPTLDLIIQRLIADGRVPLTLAELAARIDENEYAFTKERAVYPYDIQQAPRETRVFPPRNFRDLFFGPFELTLGIVRRTNRNRTFF